MTQNNSVDSDPKIPVSLLWDRTLYIAIRQSLDSEVAQSLMETALDQVIATNSKTAIVDILGLEVMDTAVANYFLNIASAMRLLGCQMIISGLSAPIAQTLVQLKVDLGDIVTTATSRQALEIAMRNAGYKVYRMNEDSDNGEYQG